MSETQQISRMRKTRRVEMRRPTHRLALLLLLRSIIASTAPAAAVVRGVGPQEGQLILMRLHLLGLVKEVRLLGGGLRRGRVPTVVLRPWGRATELLELRMLLLLLLLLLLEKVLLLRVVPSKPRRW